jgi:competence protein ComEA
MLNKFVAALAALLAASAFAAVEANKATQAELEAISGIGPTLSANIVAERKKGDFKDWNDLFKRVQGVGDRSAAKFSAGGMTINGKPYGGAPYVEPTKAASGAGGKSSAASKSATSKTGSTQKADKAAKAPKPAASAAKK